MHCVQFGYGGCKIMMKVFTKSITISYNKEKILRKFEIRFCNKSENYKYSFYYLLQGFRLKHYFNMEILRFIEFDATLESMKRPKLCSN